MFLFVCSLYLPANAQLTHRQQEKRVAGISFLEVPDVMTSGNKVGYNVNMQDILLKKLNMESEWINF